MDIKVVAVGYLAEFVEKGAASLVGQWDGRELGVLLAALPIPESLAYVALVNGERQPKSHLLSSGDVVKIVPLLTGG